MDLKAAADAVIENRRSIYVPMFGDGEVDDTIINKMLSNANWAPTHKLTEPWRFVVFKGDGIKKLADFQATLYKLKNTDNFDDKKFKKLQQKPLECSHIIAIGMKRDAKKVVPEVEEVCATACAVQNALLTAAAHKIGCYWSTGGITYYEEAKPFFGLSKEDMLLGFLYIGPLKSDKWPEGKRKEIGEKVSWVDTL
ncbi:MAG: nitroreductase [Fulvivirga sp.]|nr:nitroreductase [Fulvivirga sp.]